MKGKFFLLIFAASFVFISCATLRKETKPEYIHERVISDKDMPPCADGYKYIFVRLYSPDYTETFSPENLLKFLIGTTQVSEIESSHASIGFNLEDSFVGFTSSVVDGYQLNFEECTNIHSNPYMEKADPSNSIQITYALRVTEKEYYKALRLVNRYLKNKNAHYSINKNVMIAGKSIKRKFLTPKEKRQLKEQGNKILPVIENRKELSFVCSSFVTYILINSVDDIREFFDENNLNYNFITPSDIAEFPGMTEILRSTWDKCDYSSIYLPK